MNDIMDTGMTTPANMALTAFMLQGTETPVALQTNAMISCRAAG